MSETILERVAAGDATAVDQCLQSYGGLVWSIARKYSPNHQDAEDAVQEVFIELWRKADRFDPDLGSEPTFITMIARRRLIDRYRKKSRQPDASTIRDDLAADPPEADLMEISEEAQRARQAMEQLRPVQRQILELSIVHGLSQPQIADTTNLPLGTVKTHARRGLIKLRELLGTAETQDAKGGGP